MNIDKFKIDSKEIEINYSEMKDNLLKILDTNYGRKLTRIELYNNFFLLDDKYSFYKSDKKIPILDTKDYNNYYTIFDVLNQDCGTVTYGLQLYEESEFNIKKLIKNDVDIVKILDANNNVEKLSKESELYKLYDDLKSSNHNDCKNLGKLLKNILGFTAPVKFAIYIKIIAKFLNPDIDENKISNKELPFLTILDLDNSITQEEKKILLNLLKLGAILNYKYSESYVYVYKLPYYKQNSDLIESIQSKMIVLINKLRNLLDELNLNDKNQLNIKYSDELILYIFSHSQYSFLNSLFGSLDFKDNKKVYSNYKDFEYDIYDENFDITKLNGLDRYIKPIIFNIGKRQNEVISNDIDEFFKKIVKKDVELFSSILKTTSLDERNDLIMELLKINKNDLSLKENTKFYKKIVNISTTKKEELKKVFHKSEIESKCPKIIDNYESVLNISKQFYDNAISITSYAPYFTTYPINIDNQGSESGFTTGPTKQIMYNLSNLLNYIVRFNNDKNKTEFITPIWADDNVKFYTFLTHYLLIDLNLEISKINFNLNFKMLITLFIHMYDKNPTLFNENNNTILSILKNFNKFLNISNVKDLFFENDEPKYENIPEDYLRFYNKICLFLIADLIDGGNEYKLLKDEETRDFILDPEAEFLETKLESYKMPDGFLDFNSFKIFYPTKSEGELYKLIEKTLFKIYFIINDDKSFTSEDIIEKINFTNESDDNKYDVLNDYLKRIITDYSKDLPDDLVKYIKEIYPNQESFNKKVLLAWTASVNLTDSTELKFIVTSDVGQLIRIYTCFNTIYYPSPRENQDSGEIKYEDFANIFLQAINDVGFGLRGGKKTKKKKYKLQTINHNKKSKKLILENLLEKVNKNNNKFNKKTKNLRFISKNKRKTRK